jgi:hypothetical protein
VIFALFAKKTRRASRRHGTCTVRQTIPPRYVRTNVPPFCITGVCVRVCACACVCVCVCVCEEDGWKPVVCPRVLPPRSVASYMCVCFCVCAPLRFRRCSTAACLVCAPLCASPPCASDPPSRVAVAHRPPLCFAVRPLQRFAVAIRCASALLCWVPCACVRVRRPSPPSQCTKQGRRVCRSSQLCCPTCRTQV